MTVIVEVRLILGSNGRRLESFLQDTLHVPWWTDGLQQTTD